MIKVKQLEWHEPELKPWLQGSWQIMQQAHTSIGTYLLVIGSQGKFEIWFDKSPFSGAYSSIEGALEFAQKEHDRMILSCIEEQ